MKLKHLTLSILAFQIVGSLAFPQVGLAKPVAFTIDDPTGRDMVSFTSDAPIELIAGRTNKLGGKIVIDDSLDLSKVPLETAFQVDLDSIDTGIEMRNQHMRDNFLETSKFPQASFKLTKLATSPIKLADGKTVTLNAVGQFTIHGKTVQKSIPVTVTYFAPCDESKQKSQACDAIVIKTTFPVKLEEHNIQRPEMLLQKLADTVFVTVAATARRSLE